MAVAVGHFVADLSLARRLRKKAAWQLSVPGMRLPGLMVMVSAGFVFEQLLELEFVLLDWPLLWWVCWRLVLLLTWWWLGLL